MTNNHHVTSIDEPCLKMSVQQLDYLTEDSFQRGYELAWKELQDLWEVSPEKVKEKLDKRGEKDG